MILLATSRANAKTSLRIPSRLWRNPEVRHFITSVAKSSPKQPGPENSREKLAFDVEARENIYTLPNLLTISRILACPILGYLIVKGNFAAATGLLIYAGTSDWVNFYSFPVTFNLSAQSDYPLGRRLSRTPL